jgi:hypothetical protein
VAAAGNRCGEVISKRQGTIMKRIKSKFITGTLIAIAAIVLVGCAKNDAISNAEQADKKAGVAAPGIEETKKIAEEGFIYGLPIVMNYAVMNEFAVDTKSSQYKAPFNEFNSMHRVATPDDTAVVNYTITFPAGQLPPVNSFWSLTMYDGKSQLLIKNPINRYLLNSPMLPGMKKNADGSLTLYIQKDSPGADKEANWLPAPNDTIYLVMRLYWPKPEAPSVLPPGDGAWKPLGIVKV